MGKSEPGNKSSRATRTKKAPAIKEQTAQPRGKLRRLSALDVSAARSLLESAIKEIDPDWVPLTLVTSKKDSNGDI